MSNNINSEGIWLIGAGNMAQAYAKVLKAQGQDFLVIGRGEKSAQAFFEATGKEAYVGGIEAAIKDAASTPKFAIVSVNLESLAKVCQELIEFGVKNILVEKPAALQIKEIERTMQLANKHNAKVYVAYNRRFYSSTIRAREIIKEDGGVVSFNFEFTEWSHRIKTFPYSSEVFENWFLANSTHVIDLAFFLGGHPKQMNCYTAGTSNWYKKASTFAGAGVSVDDALFSYSANWKGPGRWWVEVITPVHKLIFRPMEKLQIQEIGSIAINSVEIDDKLDTDFKPGIYLQSEAFLAQKDLDILLNINDHYDNCKYYLQIENSN